MTHDSYSEKRKNPHWLRKRRKTIPVTTGDAMPFGHRPLHTESYLGRLREAIGSMALAEGKPTDQSFSVLSAGDQKLVYDAAKQIGARVRTVKINGHGFKVWRKS